MLKEDGSKRGKYAMYNKKSRPLCFVIFEPSWDGISSPLHFHCLLLINTSLCIPFVSLHTIMFPIIVSMFNDGVANETIPTMFPW